MRFWRTVYWVFGYYEQYPEKFDFKQSMHKSRVCKEIRELNYNSHFKKPYRGLAHQTLEHNLS